MNYTVVRTCQIKKLPEMLERYIGFKADGVFVEVGAEDGLHCSNTWTLAELGWEGLAFEPSPEAFQRCCQTHEKHDGVLVLPYAVADRPGRRRLYLDGQDGCASTLRQDLLPSLKKIGARTSLETYISVETVTLDQELGFYGWPRGFDLLSVDAVGAEQQVLAGFDLSRWKPKLMVWELRELHPAEGLRRAGEGLRSEIEAAGYRRVYTDMQNTVFARGDLGG
jgi:FkbM family methyltransferase